MCLDKEDRGADEASNPAARAVGQRLLTQVQDRLQASLEVCRCINPEFLSFRSNQLDKACFLPLKFANIV